MKGMFICNIKLSRTKFFKGILGFMAIICIALAGVGIFKIYRSNRDFETLGGDCLPPSGETAYLTDENYTNVLKQVHENLDTYIGQKICYTGYVYRATDFQENQFVLARDMQLENSEQTVIVGFLCNSENAKNFDTYAWVRVTGTIEKGYYFGDIPCLTIQEMEKTETPENCVVPAPNENFIQTSVIY